MLLWKPLRTLLWRLTLAFSSIVGGVLIFRWSVLKLVEFWITPERAASFMFRPFGTIASALLGYWSFVKLHERRSVDEMKPKPLSMALAALSGGALISVTIAALFAMGCYQMQHYRGFGDTPRVFVYIGIAALLEELVFRAVLFRMLEQHSGTMRALWIQSVVFAGLHLSNPGVTAMTLLSVTLLGAFWTMIFVYSRNLWVVSCNHAAWNLAIFFSGIPLSGTEDWRNSAPLQSQFSGPVWLSGGGFGPEDSILNVLLMGVVLASMIQLAARKELLVDKLEKNGGFDESSQNP